MGVIRGKGAPHYSEGWKRDEEFWLEDETVILVARYVDHCVYAGPRTP